MATSGKPFIPMVSSTPPPIDDGFEDEDDDDFGSFATAGFGKDLVGSPPSKSLKSTENDRHFKPIENSITDSVLSAKEVDSDFGNFASFDEHAESQRHQQKEHVSFGKTVNAPSKESASKYIHETGDLFAEFSSSVNGQTTEVIKINGSLDHKEYNHIESSSNNNSAGDTESHSNYINSLDSVKDRYPDAQEQETDHSFRFSLSKEDTLDLRQPNAINVDEETDDINWDMQGTMTPSPRSRSPENSTSGTCSPHAAGVCEEVSISAPSDAHQSNESTGIQSSNIVRDEIRQLGNKDDEFGDFSSIATSADDMKEIKPPSFDTENMPSSNLATNLGHSEKVTDSVEPVETHLNSRTKDDSFADFSTGPSIVLNKDSEQISVESTCEIPHKDQSDCAEVTKNQDTCKTFHSDDEESSCGRPEPPEYPDHDHEEEEDEFGDFGSFTKLPGTGSSLINSQSKALPLTSSEWNKQDSSDDDFGDFGAFKSISSKKEHSSTSNDNTARTPDEFRGVESLQRAPVFKSQTGTLSSTKKTDDFGAFQDSEVKETDEDEFGDFGTFNSSSQDPSTSGNFGSFASSGSQWTASSSKPTQTSASSWGTSRVAQVFQTCFPTVSSNSDMSSSPVQTVELLADIIEHKNALNVQQRSDHNQMKTKKKQTVGTVCVSVWAHLSDLENTHAVKYQWANSCNNKQLLTALGLDSRNILASKKAAGIPIFAANLGMLTPSKPGEKSEQHQDILEDSPEETPTSTAASPNNSSTTPPDESVPKAEFDWSSSGLTNPLDANSLNLDFFTKECRSSSSYSSSHSGPASSKAKSRSAPPIDPEILGLEINLPTPAKPRQNTSKPLDDILKNSATSMVTQRNKRDSDLSQEANRILDNVPKLSFMHAKVLMFPVGPSPLTRNNGDDFSGKKESTL